MNYTKGPWKVKERHQRDTLQWDIQARYGESWKTIFKGNHYGNEHSNADIAAAAPEMFEALAEIVEYSERVSADISDQDTGWYYQFQSAVQKANKAIANAKGKTL